METITDAIRRKLDARFSPVSLTIADDSGRHRGHAGARPEGETHFSVTIVSPQFEGLSRVARHRLVYDALGEEFARGLHALAIRAVSPGEIEKED